MSIRSQYRGAEVGMFITSIRNSKKPNTMDWHSGEMTGYPKEAVPLRWFYSAPCWLWRSYYTAYN